MGNGEGKDLEFFLGRQVRGKKRKPDICRDCRKDCNDILTKTEMVSILMKKLNKLKEKCQFYQKLKVKWTFFFCSFHRQNPLHMSFREVQAAFCVLHPLFSEARGRAETSCR